MRYILWSGGFDSTYLLCKRAREEEGIIQPVYEVVTRYSTAAERKQRIELLKLIRAKPEVKATIRDPIEISEENVPESAEYDAAYERWKDKISRQWVTIGKMGLIFPHAEIAIEAPPPARNMGHTGRTETLMLENGLSIDGEGNITEGVGDADLLLLFGNLRFPILHTNAAEELAAFKEWGWMDVAKATRTCITLLDRQCGVCKSCELKWMYGDAFRFLFTERAQKDHEIKEWLRKKDEKYVELFESYVRNGDWVTVTAETDEASQAKTEAMNRYFSYLENNWPNAGDINAPAY